MSDITRTTEELLEDADFRIIELEVLSVASGSESAVTNYNIIKTLIAELSAKLRESEKALIAVDDVLKEADREFNSPEDKDQFSVVKMVMAREIREALLATPPNKED